jgi:hypothetical protein
MKTKYIFLIFAVCLLVFSVGIYSFAYLINENQEPEIKTPPYMKDFYTCMPVNHKIILDKRCS